jgi:hypothetical protein
MILFDFKIWFERVKAVFREKIIIFAHFSGDGWWNCTKFWHIIVLYIFHESVKGILLSHSRSHGIGAQIVRKHFFVNNTFKNNSFWNFKFCVSFKCSKNDSLKVSGPSSLYSRNKKLAFYSSVSPISQSEIYVLKILKCIQTPIGFIWKFWKNLFPTRSR